MKVSNKTKGIVDYTEIMLQEMEDAPFLEPSDEEIEHQISQHEVDVQLRKSITQAQQDWDTQGEANLQIILYETGAIAQRLTYLLDKMGIEKAAFARQVGLGRTTIHRYTSGDSTPNEKKLRVIIDALSMSIADFCFEPKDFSKWKAALEETTARQHDIFELRNRLLDELSKNDFTFTHNGEPLRLPHKYYTILRAIVENGFRVLDFLPHDE